MLSPPARRTTRSKPASALSVAWGFVAFESSKYSTPEALPTGCTRWWSLGKFTNTSRAASTRPPTATAAAVAASAFVRSWGIRDGRALTSTISSPDGVSSEPLPTVYAALDVVERDADGPDRRGGGEVAHDRIVEVRDEHIVVALVLEHPGLDRGVLRERAVPVDVVLGHVQQDGDLRPERGGGGVHLERRDLGDDDLPWLFDDVEQRAADVARRLGPYAGRVQDRGDQGRDRALAVRARDRDDRHACGLHAEVDVATDRDARRDRRDERGMLRPNPWARDHQIGVGHQADPHVGVGPLDDRCAQLARFGDPRLVRALAGVVLHHRHGVAAARRGPHHRGARGPQTDDQHPAHSMMPGIRMKSA